MLLLVAISALLVCQGHAQLLHGNDIHRSLIAEVGDAANQHFTASACKSRTTNFTDCFLTSSNAKDYPWGSPQIRYPRDGSAWGIHLTGPYPDGRSYLVSWFTGAATIGPNLRQPTTSHLVTHVTAWVVPTTTTELPPGPLVYPGSIITYLRPYEGALANYSYLSPYIHHVVLTGLLPSTTYTYQVSNRDGSMVEYYNFTTLPAAPDARSTTPYPSPYPLRIGIIGDVGQTRNSSETRDHLMSNKPQVVLHLGDSTYSDNYHASSPDLLKAGGTNQQRWDSFQVLWAPLLRTVPMLNVPGNHDVESSGIRSSISLTTTSWSYPTNFPFQSYAARFPPPGATDATPFGNITAAMYYATVLGGVAKLISINNYIAYHRGSPQYNFVLQELRSVDRSRTPWVIVMYHTATYHTYSNHYKSMECFLSIWEDIFYQYGVDLIFNGHVHAYERTHPVYKYRQDDCAPIYVTVGDGGNVEGLYRSFVDDVSNGKTLCEGFLMGGKTPAQLYYTNPGGWSSAGPRPPNCSTVSFQPPSGVAGGPPVMTLNVTEPGQPLLGFCQSSQPLWSARRDPSFGHAILDLLSESRARFRWFKNIVGSKVAVDDVELERKNTCVNRRRNLRRQRHAARRMGA